MKNHQRLSLQEWIDLGRANGTIREILTVIYAYSLDEPVARRWITHIVMGQLTEQEALVAVKAVMVDGEVVAWW